MNTILFFLTVGSTIFTPVTFMSSVYGMNFESKEGVPTIPFLLEEYGYTYFWCLGLVGHTSKAYILPIKDFKDLENISFPRQKLWKSIEVESSTTLRYGVLGYFALAISCVVILYRRFLRSPKRVKQVGCRCMPCL